MQKRSEARGMLIVAVVALAVGVASYAVVRIDPWAERGGRLPATFRLDVSDLVRVDPALIRYTQTAEIPAGFEQVRAVAAGPQGTVYVAGDRAVRVFPRDGRRHAVIPLEGEPSCLAVGDAHHAWPGRLYVGAGRQIATFDPQGAPVGTWEVPGRRAILTSIALGPNDVFVADAARRVVLRFDVNGKLVGTIGAPRPDREMPGFVVPSPYFDVAVDREGLVHVANPGALRIESFSAAGQLETFWGKAGSAIGDFFGCCNPSHFALLPSGEFVTSEKGIPRVKVYSEAGELECVVAGPEQLGIAESEIGDPRFDQARVVFDVATDSDGRVLVLDPKKKSVRIFTRTETAQGADR